jgi:hypothetical protein
MKFSVTLFFLIFNILCSNAAAAECQEAIRKAESLYRLPYQLLETLSMVSRMGVSQQLSPSPWSLNIDGDYRTFNTKDEAIEAFKKHRKTATSIAVGCMQFNLINRIKEFSTLEEAFDPLNNVMYSAKYLADLKKTQSQWSQTIVIYGKNFLTAESDFEDKIFKKQVLHVWKSLRDLQSEEKPAFVEEKEISGLSKEEINNLIEKALFFFVLVFFYHAAYVYDYLRKNLKNQIPQRKRITEKLYFYRPREVYCLSSLLGIALFLNFPSVLKLDFSGLFEYSRSPVHQMICGIGGISRFRSEPADTLYWILLITFVFLTLIKAKKISQWLWNE